VAALRLPQRQRQLRLPGNGGIVTRIMQQLAGGAVGADQQVGAMVDPLSYLLIKVGAGASAKLRCRFIKADAIAAFGQANGAAEAGKAAANNGYGGGGCQLRTPA